MRAIIASALLASQLALAIFYNPFYRRSLDPFMFSNLYASKFKDDFNETTAEQNATLRPGRMIFKNDTFISDFIQVIDSSVPQFSSLYFLLAESRSNKTNKDQDPLVIWLNGGPGCSSMLGAFTELGPYNYKYNASANETDDKFKMIYNDYAWNNNANVMFVDQPIGTGFSFTNKAQNMRTNEEQIAADFYKFLQGFYSKYPEYKLSPLYITGESFAGHYIPAIANYLFVNSDIKIAGLAIGNGWVDPFYQYPSYATYALQNGIIKEGHATVLQLFFHLCQYALILEIPIVSSYMCMIPGFTIMNPAYPDFNLYDIREPCVTQGLCYPNDHMEDLLNSDIYRNKFQVLTEQAWQMCADTPHLMLSFDQNKMAGHKLAQLLDNDVPILIYNGDQDYICNWMGGLTWTEALEWSGYDQYNQAPVKLWKTNSKKSGGQSKSYGPLTFLRVFNAGHMVPMDQPQVALEMLSEFIKTKTINSKPNQ